MATSYTEKIAEIKQNLSNLGVRVDNFLETAAEESEWNNDCFKKAEIRHENYLKSFEELRVEIGILKNRVDELTKHKDETGRRVWQLIFMVIGLIAGSLMTAIFKR